MNKRFLKKKVALNSAGPAGTVRSPTTTTLLRHLAWHPADPARSLCGNTAASAAVRVAVDSNRKQTEVLNKLENRLLQILAAADDNKKQEDFAERGEDITTLDITENESDQNQAETVDMLESKLHQILTGEDGALDIRGQADDGLVKKPGCEGHQAGDQWGTSDHDNCICQSPDRLCYHVDCLPGSEIVRGSDDLWDCEVVSSKRDITGSVIAVHDTVKRITKLDAFGVFSGVLGIVGFIADRIEAAQTTAQLNEIQDQIRELDRKVDELTRSVGQLQLGQDYIAQVTLYGRDELRLKNMLDTHAKMQISNGLYVLPGYDIQRWAESVISYGPGGAHQILHNLLNMVDPQEGVFDGKSFFEIYHQRLIDEGEKYSEKMSKKVAQVYGLIGGGYALWITALRITGRTSEIPDLTQKAKTNLKTLESTLEKYTKVDQRRVCEHGTLPIHCPAEKRINILFALYGRTSREYCGGAIYTTNCHSSNSGARVRSSCQGRSSCSVAANNGVFGDPCPGTVKYLEVEFSCIEAEPRRVCEHGTLPIHCPAGKRINILFALYGRTSREYCGGAIYTTNCYSSNSGARVRSSCQGRSSCSVAANNGVFGDPCPGTVKYLEVDFSCIGR
ncbi:EVA1C [Branchiostoma lanceolatum]|uniref:EVA1C protein n=1 Tax=Branchiostoma lanceolatum TaxID=7740 RepID=A0A8K0EXZ6_BRALA|nr:EVA1C [Branchiostoma lanceolatum]